VKYLLDTHLLLWAAESEQLGEGLMPAQAAAIIDDSNNELLFSAASIWEVALKNSLGRSDFQADPSLLRRGLLDNGYTEIPIESQHAVAVSSLPTLHKDPFDRMLIAQAIIEGIELLTSDALVAAYPGPIRQV
jgi:PIN domain nuclease of toxin-antitoxin system